MNPQTRKSLIVLLFLSIVLAVSAVTSLACRNCWMEHDPEAVTSLTGDQQKKLDGVHDKYAARLDELQTALNNKSDAYTTASTNDDTTIGELKRLESERAELEQQYWALLDQANGEAGQSVSAGARPWFTCNYNGCDHQHHRGGPDHAHDHGMGNNHPSPDAHEHCRSHCWK